MAEFGSSPDLYAEMMRDPVLWLRFIASIPDIKDHPRRGCPTICDIAKFAGVIKAWNGREWIDPCGDDPWVAPK